MKKVIPISKSSIGLKCGDCLFFKQNRKFEKPCTELGVKHFSVAPACFSPNVYKLGAKNPDVILQLGLLLRDFDASDVRVLMSILKQQTAFEKHYGLKFGQPVYVRIGDDYVSNYYRAFVIGVAECGDSMVFLASDLAQRQRQKPAVMSLFRDSLLTTSQWKVIRKRLQDADKVVDPKGHFAKRIQNSMVKVDYEPPTIDQAPKEQRELKTKKINKKHLVRAADGSFEYVL